MLGRRMRHWHRGLRFGDVLLLALQNASIDAGAAYGDPKLGPLREVGPPGILFTGEV